MSIEDFRETAYQAMDRRDLLNGIYDFLSDSIVLPPGDFDKELLYPILETSKLKRMNSKRRSTRAQSHYADRLNDADTHQHTQSSK
jgi:solute carrier family 4 (anion exchanger), member 2